MMEKDLSVSSSPSDNESTDPGNDPINPDHIIKFELHGLSAAEYDMDDNDTIFFNSQDDDWCDYYSNQDSDDEVQFKCGKQNNFDTMSISLSQKSSQESVSCSQESYGSTSQSSQGSSINDGGDSMEKLSDISSSQSSGVKDNSAISRSIVSVRNKKGSCAKYLCSLPSSSEVLYISQYLKALKERGISMYPSFTKMKGDKQNFQRWCSHYH